MATRAVDLHLLFLLLSAPSRSASLSPLSVSWNASLQTSTFPDSEQIPAPDPTFLQEVIDSLWDKYNWEPDAEVQVWPLDAVQLYQFRARAADSVGVARVSDETVECSRPGEPAVEEISGPDGINGVPDNDALGSAWA